MNKLIVLLIALLLIVSGIYFVFPRPNVIQNNDNTNTAEITNFDECVAAGYPVQESYPARCSTPDGKNFTEDIGNEMEMADLIKINDPRPNAKVASPLTISGQARGTWYFEASFPVQLQDASGNVIASGIAQAQSDWMTEDFVPFKASLEFIAPATATGNLVLKKDNPSGLPENDKSLTVPVKF